jgi:RNA polymerase sigma-70 factor, ECF subfamily
MTASNLPESHHCLTQKAPDFNSIFAEHRPGLVRFATWMIHDPDKAEDVVQETLLVAFKKWDQLDCRDRLLPWLNQITANKAKALMRSKKNQTVSLDSPIKDGDRRTIADTAAAPTVDPEDNADTNLERLPLVLDRLRALPPRLREPVEMFFFKGIPKTIIAKHFGCTYGGIIHRIRRALLVIGNPGLVTYQTATDVAMPKERLDAEKCIAELSAKRSAGAKKRWAARVDGGDR